MANLIDVLGQQSAAQNTADPTAGLKQGLQAGVQLAQAQNQVAQQQQQLQENELDINQKKLTSIANASRALLYADDTTAPFAQKRLSILSQQLNTPVDVDALVALRKDPNTRLTTQKLLSDLALGKVPDDPGEVLSRFADNEAMFAAVYSRLGQNVEAQQKIAESQAKIQSAERIAILGNQTKLDVADLNAQARAELQAAKAASAPTKLSEGQKAVDRKYATDFVDWNNNGGAAGVNKNLAQLEAPLKKLESGSGSGGVLDALPKSVQDYVNRDNAAIQDSVSEVVQSSLKATLGAQFTEREGAGILARAFNPRQSPQENAKRVRRLLKSISDSAQAKQDSADYFAENGTLKGFKGKTRFDIGGVSVDVNNPTGGSSTEPSVANELQAPKPQISDKKKAQLKALVEGKVTNPKTGKPYTQADIAPYM
jgi:hypothetical protein